MRSLRALAGSRVPQSDAPLRWWRIELDAEGGVLSCAPVERAKRGELLVVYVRADDAKSAQRRAKGWYERKKARQVKSSRKLREARAARGLCRTCETPALDGKVLCQRHTDLHNAANDRYRRGVTKPRVADVKKMFRKETEYQRRRDALLVQLPDVLDKYDEVDGAYSGFRLFLQTEIARREREPDNDSTPTSEREPPDWPF